jgi:hypothetical protein
VVRDDDGGGQEREPVRSYGFHVRNLGNAGEGISPGESTEW